jgi:ABC-2 type transport system permease protein
VNPVREFGAAFVATWRGILADKAALLLLFVAGVVYSFFYPLPYSRESVQQVPIAIVDQDASALSRQIARFAFAHPAVQVRLVTPQASEAQDLLWKGEIAGTLFIPPGLQREVLAGRKAEVEIAGNGVYMMLNKAALNGLAEAVGTVSAGIEIKRNTAAAPMPAQAQAQRKPVTLASEPLFNVREGYGSYMVPAVAVLIVQQTLLMGICLLFGTRVEQGGAHAPRPLASYLGTLGAFASVAAINCLYYFGFVMWWQDYPRGGNLGGLLLFIVLFAFAAAALGMLIGLLFRTRERSLQLLIGTAMPLMFVSGISWPAEALPQALRLARWLVPSTAGIQGFVALNQLGASLWQVRFEAGVLLALSVVCAVAGAYRWTRCNSPLPRGIRQDTL